MIYIKERAMKVESKITPRYAETDKMGIIHHAVYPIYYEIGRTDFCKQLGLPYHLIEERGITQALVNLEVKYKRPAVYGDELTLVTTLKRYDAVTCEFKYELYNQNNELINIGTTRMAWLDKDTLTLTGLHKNHRDILQLLENALEK